MYFLPDGTKRCGLYECELCSARLLSVNVVPAMFCTFCAGEVENEVGPDEYVEQVPDSAKLIKIVEDEEEIILLDGMLGLAVYDDDESWL
jgi:hypothetical protein